jgi:hypothetical protein
MLAAIRIGGVTMRSRSLLFMVLALSLLAADGRKKTPKAQPLAVGTRAPITIPVRKSSALSFTGKEPFRLFLQAVKDNDVPAIARLYVDRKLVARRPGEVAEVLEVFDDESYPLHVPLARVKVADETVWVPLQHLRPLSEPLPSGEDRLPVLFEDRVAQYRPKEGDVVQLFNDDPGEVVAAAEYSALARYALARDRKAALQGGAVVLVADWAEATVVDPSPHSEKKGISALRVRLSAPPHEGKEVWVAADHCRLKDEGEVPSGFTIRTYDSVVKKRAR